VLDLVAGRAEGDQALKRLQALVVVIVPDFVALDWMPATFIAADLAFVPRRLVTGFTKLVPFGPLEAGPQVVSPRRFGHQFNP
jgi:hypothetical protein